MAHLMVRTWNWRSIAWPKMMVITSRRRWYRRFVRTTGMLFARNFKGKYTTCKGPKVHPWIQTGLTASSPSQAIARHEVASWGTTVLTSNSQTRIWADARSCILGYYSLDE